MISVSLIVSVVQIEARPVSAIERVFADGQVVSGGDGSGLCAINEEGVLRCWGFSTNPISASTYVSQISLGRFNVCAITIQRVASCFGDMKEKKNQIPADLGPLLQISAGATHTCAITDAGKAKCWGESIYGLSAIPKSATDSRFISVGDNHVCSIDISYALKCWGDIPERLMVPSDLGSVSEVSAGSAHTCARTSAGYARCWGSNEFGQATVPSDLGKISQISSKKYHSCAIKDTGSVVCWGKNDHGESSVPSDLGKVIQIDSGDVNTCAVTDIGEAKCWGYNYKNQFDVPRDFGLVLAGYPKESELRPVLSITGSNSPGNLVTSSITGIGEGFKVEYQWNSVVGGSTYMTTMDDLGKQIRLRAVISKYGYQDTDVYSNVINVNRLMAAQNPCGLGPKKILDVTVIDSPRGDITHHVIPKVGETFTVDDRGMWPAGTKTCTFWISGSNALPDTNRGRYVLQGSDLGKSFRYAIVGTNGNRITMKLTPSIVVAKATFKSSNTPSITGIPQLGQKLLGKIKPWMSSTKYSYQWLKNGSPINSAKSESYAPKATDVGSSIALQACGIQPYYETLCRTSKSIIIRPATLTKIGNLAIVGKSTNVGSSLQGSTTQWMSGTTLNHQWLMNDMPIPGETKQAIIIRPEFRGKTLKYQVTASRTGYAPVTKISKGAKIS